MSEYTVLVPFELNGRIPYMGQVINIDEKKTNPVRLKEWLDRNYVKEATKEDIANWQKKRASIVCVNPAISKVALAAQRAKERANEDDDTGEDEAEAALTEAKNRAESLLDSVKQALEKSGDKLPEKAKEAVKKVIDALNGVLSSEKTQEITKKTDALDKLFKQHLVPLTGDE